MIDIQFLGLVNATLQAATLLFIAALGELIAEKSGVLNLGVEGMISIGAVSGFITAINTENLFLSIIVGIVSASLFSSIHAFVTVILKQDQTVSGLILTILGLSLSSLIGKKYVGKTTDVDRRMDQHFSGNGSKVTKKFKPIDGKTIDEVPGFFSDDVEQEYTEDYIEKYGYNNVRGGYYTNSQTLEKNNKKQYVTKKKQVKCYKCGKYGHYANQCYSNYSYNSYSDDDFDDY